MTKKLRDPKTGQYAGSIGDGKLKTPKPQGFLAKRKNEKEQNQKEAALDNAYQEHVQKIFENVADYVLQKSETSNLVELPSGLGTFLYTRLYGQLYQKGYRIVDLEMYGNYTLGRGTKSEKIEYTDEQLNLLKKLFYSVSNQELSKYGNNPSGTIPNLEQAVPGACYLRGLTFEREGRTIITTISKKGYLDDRNQVTKNV